jgi:putative flippase GtrA
MSNATVLLERARIGQFVSVGMVGAAIETVIVFLLTATVGFPALAAKAVGAEASITTMFLVNDNWTFSEEGVPGVLNTVRRWGKSHLVRIVGLGIAFTVLLVLTGYTEVSLSIAGFDLWPTVANGIGIGVGMVVNYVFESVFTWRVLAE